MKKWMLIVCEENGQHYFFNGDWPIGLNPTGKLWSGELWRNEYPTNNDLQAQKWKELVMLDVKDLNIWLDSVKTGDKFSIANKEFIVLQTGNFAFTK